MIIKEGEDFTDSFKLNFNDLGEQFWGLVILTKIPSINNEGKVKIVLNVSDAFLSERLKEAKDNPSIMSSQENFMDKNFRDFFSIFIDKEIAEEFFPKEPKVSLSLSDYYNPKVNRALKYLTTGDSGLTKPCLEGYKSLGFDELGLETFEIELCREKFIRNFKETVLGIIFFVENAFAKLSNVVDVSQPGVSISKQLEFLRTHIDERLEKTGESRFGFSLKDVNYRRVMLPIGGQGGFGIIPSPLTTGAGVKSNLPSLLAIQGELDIDSVRVISSLSDVEDVNLQFSVCKPAKRNVFGAEYCSLSVSQRNKMSVVELNAYEGVVKILQKNNCFINNSELEKDFIEFSSWIIRKVTYCLEEPSFLKQKANRWIDIHKDDSYQRMEDDLFLPFIYEKLRDEFGSKVTKKPERFGGNVDILFGELPVELKVRKGSSEMLLEGVVDEKYKPTSQAAAYAALTRLGCVLVLDIDSKQSSLTNISACVKVVTKKFSEAELPTSIPVFIFQCNTPTPSKAN